MIEFESIDITINPNQKQRPMLWPKTNPDGIQKFIKAKQGVKDDAVGNPMCRTTIIGNHLKELIKRKDIPRNFTLLDICCGDAIIITCLKTMFKQADIIGVDIHGYDTHLQAAQIGVRIYRCYLQSMLGTRLQQKIDVALMLNSYRNWKSAGAKKGIRRQLEAWLKANVNHVIVTTAERPRRLLHRGFTTERIGVGEGGSKMVCLKPIARNSK